MSCFLPVHCKRLIMSCFLPVFCKRFIRSHFLPEHCELVDSFLFFYQCTVQHTFCCLVDYVLILPVNLNVGQLIILYMAFYILRHTMLAGQLCYVFKSASCPYLPVHCSVISHRFLQILTMLVVVDQVLFFTSAQWEDRVYPVFYQCT